MRYRPPETKKKELNTEQFKEYLMKGEMVGCDTSYPFLEFCGDIIKKYRENHLKLAIESIIKVLPYEYHYHAYQILYKMAINGEFDCNPRDDNEPGS